MNCNTKKDGALIMTPIFLIRRFVFALTCVYLKDYNYLQIWIQVFSTTVIIIYLVHVQPFEQHSMNRMEIYNEATFLLCINMCFLFTDFVPDANMRYSIGWGFLFLVGMNFLANLCSMVNFTVSMLKVKIPEWWNDIKIWYYEDVAPLIAPKAPGNLEAL